MRVLLTESLYCSHSSIEARLAVFPDTELFSSSKDWRTFSNFLDSSSDSLAKSAIFSSIKFWAASPQTASIRRTPAEIAPSVLILNKPISPVFFKWVPPHNSIE